MSAYPRNTKAPAGRQGANIAHKGNRAYVAALGQLYGTSKSPRIPACWRDRLPDPASYYSQHVAKLGHPNASGYAQGVCPFHDDHNKSLSVCITRSHGGWRCFASCGGGDLVGFHQRRTGLDFKAAVRDLIGGGA